MSLRFVCANQELASFSPPLSFEPDYGGGSTCSAGRIGWLFIQKRLQCSTEGTHKKLTHPMCSFMEMKPSVTKMTGGALLAGE
jgi:hypothetical protein